MGFQKPFSTFLFFNLLWFVIFVLLSNRNDCSYSLWVMFSVCMTYLQWDSCISLASALWDWRYGRTAGQRSAFPELYKWSYLFFNKWGHLTWRDHVTKLFLFQRLISSHICLWNQTNTDICVILGGLKFSACQMGKKPNAAMNLFDSVPNRASLKLLHRCIWQTKCFLPPLNISTMTCHSF